MVSHYSTDRQVAVTCQDMLQCASKSRKVDCKLVSMDVTKLDLKYLKKSVLQMFNGGNTLSKFVRPVTLNVN